jgi:tetratricopeptide (TPR) repeat protein
MPDPGRKRAFRTSAAATGGFDPLSETRAQLQKAEQLRLRGEIERARAICEPLVTRHGNYFGALHTLGLIHADKGNLPMALALLVRAVMLNPRSWATLKALGDIYLRLGAPEMAASTLEQARAIKPEAGILATLGRIHRERCDYQLAADVYREALAIEPASEAASLGLAVCCIDLGLHSEAARLLEGLIRRGTRSPGMLLDLLALPPSLVTVDILSELGKVARCKGEDEADFESSVAFIRAGCLDRAGRHAEAWEHLVKTNRTMHLARGEELRELTEVQEASLLQLRDAALRPAASRGSDKRTISLFILGPSRSGKTSLETMLASLDGVRRGYENPILEEALRRTFQSAGFLTTSDFSALPPHLYPLCGEIYLDDLARRAGQARVFTLTHPAHIHVVARIAAAVPDSRFLFVKRERDDNALRIYMRKYKVAPYAYDLRSIYAHLGWYDQMIDLAAERLPGMARVVQYEEMVADPAAALRIAAELCGLDAPDAPAPAMGDDRGCAAPYRQLMDAAMES